MNYPILELKILDKDQIRQKAVDALSELEDEEYNLNKYSIYLNHFSPSIEEGEELLEEEGAELTVQGIYDGLPTEENRDSLGDHKEAYKEMMEDQKYPFEHREIDVDVRLPNIEEYEDNLKQVRNKLIDKGFCDGCYNLKAESYSRKSVEEALEGLEQSFSISFQPAVPIKQDPVFTTDVTYKDNGEQGYFDVLTHWVFSDKETEEAVRSLDHWNATIERQILDLDMPVRLGEDKTILKLGDSDYY